MLGLSLTSGFKRDDVVPGSITISKSKLLNDGTVREGIISLGDGKPISFDKNIWYTFGDGDGQEKYKSRGASKDSGIKCPQMKLILSEIQFFNLYWDPKEVPNPICLYVGAAPGHHLLIMKELYPHFRYVLYDPSNFDSELMKESQKSGSNIEIRQQYFTDQTATEWSGRNDVFFLCDIRNRQYEEGKKNPLKELTTFEKIKKEEEDEKRNKRNEDIVEADMKAQATWFKIIKPVRALLKFRPPYSYKFILDKGVTRKYLDGVIYRQLWNGTRSTESRFVPHKDESERDWNILAYEECLYYYNNVVRNDFHFINILNTSKPIISYELGLNNKFNSVCTVSILRDYIVKFGENGTEEEILNLFRGVEQVGCNEKTIKTLQNLAPK